MVYKREQDNNANRGERCVVPHPAIVYAECVQWMAKSRVSTQSLHQRISVPVRRIMRSIRCLSPKAAVLKGGSLPQR